MFSRMAALFFFLCALLAWGEPLLPDLRENEIIRVDPATRIVVVGVKEPRTFQCRADATFLIDDRPAKLEELAPGMVAVITARAPGVASRIAAIRPKVARPASTPLMEKRVTVPATANAKNAVMIGGLRAGQLITIRAEKVRWTAGGRHAGDYCGWEGYRDDRHRGLPRMALVAVVGGSAFLPAGDTFRFTVAQDGGFALFVNDDEPADNEGAAEITIAISWK